LKTNIKDMFHSNDDSKITNTGKKNYLRKNERYRGYIFSKKRKKNPLSMEYFIEYKYNLNIIQFFSQTRNRQCLKLGYDFKTLLWVRKKYFEISERAWSSSAGSGFKEL
jgi:hypothetical protein